MVDIREIPLSGEMKEKFMAFFKQYGTEIEVHGRSRAKHLVDDGYDGVKPFCSVCGKGLVNVLIARSKEVEGDFGLGLVCASNIGAITKYRGDMDKLSYDRKVRLERKTITKRMIEWERERGKLNLETRYNDEIAYLYEFMDTVEERYGGPFGIKQYMPGYNAHRLYVEVYEREIDFLHSLYLQVQRKGKLSDKQIKALQRNTKLPLETRLDNIEQGFERATREIQYEANQNRAFGKVLRLKDKWGLSSYDKRYIESVYQWNRDNKRYSDKQIAVIDRIYEKAYPEEASA